MVKQRFPTVRLGVKSLLLHKLRSALTMLGIIFGVCSVIAMLAIGEGAKKAAQEVGAFGARKVLVSEIAGGYRAEAYAATVAAASARWTGSTYSAAW